MVWGRDGGGGYLALPFRLEGGRVPTTQLAESIRGFIRVILANPLQREERPAWLPADPGFGCDVPHYRFAAEGDATRLQTAIEKALGRCEPRITDVDVRVSLPEGGLVRRRTLTVTARVVSTGEPVSVQYTF
jgi:predicted component of type VI protein secretion system